MTQNNDGTPGTALPLANDSTDARAVGRRRRSLSSVASFAAVAVTVGVGVGIVATRQDHKAVDVAARSQSSSRILVVPVNTALASDADAAAPDPNAWVTINALPVTVLGIKDKSFPTPVQVTILPCGFGVHAETLTGTVTNVLFPENVHATVPHAGLTATKPTVADVAACNERPNFADKDRLPPSAALTFSRFRPRPGATVATPTP